jgi:hypothetical protein
LISSDLRTKCCCFSDNYHAFKRKRTPSAKAAALSKQSKTSETYFSTEQPEASKTSSSTASSISQTTKQQLIDELVPAVTKGVVESLVAMQVLPGTSTTEEQTSTQDEHTTSDVQTQGNISAVSTFPQDLLTISMHVEQKTRSKIWADEYIDLGLLLPASAMDSADDSSPLRMVDYICFNVNPEAPTENHFVITKMVFCLSLFCCYLH